jgi:outer membrane lipoprotein-sorting protein
MKRAWFVLIVMWIAAAICLAQETQPKPESAAQDAQPKTEAKVPEAVVAEPLPTFDQVLDKYIEALGGRQALEKITSRQAKGNFDLPAMEATGTLTMVAKAPNKSAMTIDVPGIGVFQMAFDGAVGWENNPMVGMRELAGKELAARKRDSTFNGELKYKELFEKIVVKGKEKVAERDAYVVEATPAEGSVEKMYFDAESGLLVRHDAERESPQGSAMVETYFEDYKDVDGIKVPFTLKQVMPQFTIQIKFDEVKHNVEIEDAKFAKPAA